MLIALPADLAYLISKGRLGVSEQARALLASFEPRLGTASPSPTRAHTPRPLPEDPYSVDAIYDATLYALAWQRAAPLLQGLRPVSTLVSPSVVSPEPLQTLSADSFRIAVHTEGTRDCAVRTSFKTAGNHLAAAHAARRLLAPAFTAVTADFSFAPAYTVTAATISRVPAVPRAISTVTVRFSSPSIQVFSSQSSAPHTDLPRLVPPVARRPHYYLSHVSTRRRRSRHYQSPYSSHSLCRTSLCIHHKSILPRVLRRRYYFAPRSAAYAIDYSFAPTVKPPPTTLRAFPPELQSIQSDPSKSVTSKPVSARQHSMPFVVSPCEIPPPASSTVTSNRPIHPPPQSPRPFPRVQEQCVAMPFDSAPAMGTPSCKQHAPFVHAPRDNPRPPPSTSPSRRPSQRPPPPSHVFPPKLGPTQVVPTEVAVGESVPSSQQPALPVPSPHAISQLAPSTSASGQLIQPPPSPLYLFPHTVRSSCSAPASSALATDTCHFRQHAPLINAPRDNMRLAQPMLELRRPIQPPPPSPCMFPIAPQPPSTTPSKSATSMCATARQLFAPLVHSPRAFPPPAPSTFASREPVQVPLSPSYPFPRALHSSFAAPADSTSAPCACPSQRPAPPINLSHHDLFPSPPTFTAQLHVQSSPLSVPAFPAASQLASPSPLSQAALVDTSAGQQRASPVPVPRELSPCSAWPREPVKSSQTPPLLSQAFPLAPPSHFHAPPKSTVSASAHTLHLTAPFTYSPRALPPLVSPTSTPAKSRLLQPPPTFTLPHAPSLASSTQYETASVTHTLTLPQLAPLVGPPRTIPPLSTCTPGLCTVTQCLPPPLHLFPLAPQSPSLVPPHPARNVFASKTAVHASRPSTT